MQQIQGLPTYFCILKTINTASYRFLLALVVQLILNSWQQYSRHIFFLTTCRPDTKSSDLPWFHGPSCTRKPLFSNTLAQQVLLRASHLWNKNKSIHRQNQVNYSLVVFQFVLSIYKLENKGAKTDVTSIPLGLFIHYTVDWYALFVRYNKGYYSNFISDSFFFFTLYPCDSFFLVYNYKTYGIGSFLNTDISLQILYG